MLFNFYNNSNNKIIFTKSLKAALRRTVEIAAARFSALFLCKYATVLLCDLDSIDSVRGFQIYSIFVTPTVIDIFNKPLRLYLMPSS